MELTRGKVLKYALLPGLGSRLQDLFGSGFSTLAYFMALVFNAVRILPNNHLYLNPSSIGKFGLVQIMREAASHLKFDRNHIDQVLIYIALLAGLILLFMQFTVLIVSFVTSSAMAAGLGGYGTFFTTPYPNTDLAMRLMSLIFGVNMFGPASVGAEPIHVALHALFEFYSYGILVVGCFIILYFVVTIVTETAQTGIPFGRRFNKGWVPIRLVVFFALIIPITNGLNGAQWITLSVAKYGSAMASNGWLRFNMATAGTYLGIGDELVATPSAPEIQHLPAFIMVARTCHWAQARRNERDIQAYLIHGEGAAGSTLIDNLNYQAALTLTTDGTGPAGALHIRFGEKDPAKHDQIDGAVNPYCGQITLGTEDVSEVGSAAIQGGYFELVKTLWSGAYAIDEFARNYSFRYMTVEPQDPTAPLPDAQYRAFLATTLDTVMRQIIANGIGLQLQPQNWTTDNGLLSLGWIGAGAMYNEIASINGAIAASVTNTPSTSLYPSVLEFIKKINMQNNQNVTPGEELTAVFTSEGEEINFENIGDEDIANALTKIVEFWADSPMRSDANAGQAQDTGAIFVNAINAILGTDGLFDMCRNTDVHPLAQLSALGKGMIDSAIRNLAISGGFGLLGGTGMLDGNLGAAANTAAGFFGIVASIGLLIGFLLFYVMPFMPFIYFFFGAAAWIKSIFEAMVGVPLWALAHLRIDGEGIPAQAANNGYMMLFEIFMRPIFIIFGLVATLAIFSAQVKALNEIYYLVVSNVGGASMNATGGCVTGALSGLDQATLGNMSGMQKFIRGSVDEFFFTVMYAIIVYMMGTVSFKLIDTIPQQMVRWFGSAAPSFADNNDGVKSAGALQKYATVGGGAIGSQLKEGITSIPEEFGEARGEAGRRKQTAEQIVAGIYQGHEQTAQQAMEQFEQRSQSFDQARDRFDQLEQEYASANNARKQEIREEMEDLLRTLEGRADDFYNAERGLGKRQEILDDGFFGGGSEEQLAKLREHKDFFQSTARIRVAEMRRQALDRRSAFNSLT